MQHADTMKELIQVSRDGLAFYEDALRQIENPRLLQLFARMARHKREIIDSLSQRLRSANEDVPQGGTLVGRFRQTYADLRAALASNNEKVYVAQLEEAEDRLLEHFEEAIAQTDDPSVKAILQTHVPQVRACHDEMRSAKRQLAA